MGGAERNPYAFKEQTKCPACGLLLCSLPLNGLNTWRHDQTGQRHSSERQASRRLDASRTAWASMLCMARVDWLYHQTSLREIFSSPSSCLEHSRQPLAGDHYPHASSELVLGAGSLANRGCKSIWQAARERALVRHVYPLTPSACERTQGERGSRHPGLMCS